MHGMWVYYMSRRSDGLGAGVGHARGAAAYFTTTDAARTHWRDVRGDIEAKYPTVGTLGSGTLGSGTLRATASDNAAGWGRR